MPNLSAIIHPPDEDRDIKIELSLFSCCPTHAAAIVATIATTVQTMSPNEPTLLAIATHPDIQAEFFEAITKTGCEHIPASANLN